VGATLWISCAVPASWGFADDLVELVNLGGARARVAFSRMQAWRSAQRETAWRSSSGAKRLGQIINGAGLDGLDRQLGGGVGGDHEERGVRPAFAGLGQEFVAAHSAQAGVGDDHEELLPFPARRGPPRPTRPSARHNPPRQNGAQRKAHVLFVIDDEDRGEGETHLLNLIRMRAGNSKDESGAFAQLRLHATKPPYISVLCLTMARPRPVPLARVVK
jgi:hypothetical protein